MCRKITSVGRDLCPRVLPELKQHVNCKSQRAPETLLCEQNGLAAGLGGRRREEAKGDSFS